MVEKYIAGSDVGGTWIRIALSPLTLEKDSIQIKQVKTKKENKFSISSQICQILSDLLSENDIKRNQLLGFGLASAGPLDLKKGTSFNSPNLGFKEVPLKEPIKKEFPEIPFYLINDCLAAVLGIHYFEATEEEKDNLVYITMSTGIGGGVICNGYLVLGKDGNAAEIGHSKVAAQSNYKCGCGAYGCWEAISSGTAVRKRTLDALKNSQSKAEILLELVNHEKSKIGAKEVFEAARRGDTLSREIIDESVFYNKVGVGLINDYFDCKAIYFGGAMMNDQDLLFIPLKEEFQTETIEFTINKTPELKITQYRSEIGTMGALALVKYKVENNPVVSTYTF
jgi:glucokinase